MRPDDSFPTLVPDADLFGDEDVPTAELVATPATRFCGRCGGQVAGGGACGRCRPAAEGQPQAGRGMFKEVRDGSPAPSLAASILMYFLLLSVSLVIVAVATAGGGETGAVGELVATGFFSGIILVFALRYRRSLAPVLLRVGPARYYGYAVLASLGTFTLASVLVHLIVLVGGEQIDYGDNFTSAGYGWWVVYVLIAVQPAIFEEIAFRGLLLGGLGRYVSGKEAVAVSAAMFAVLHLAVPSMPHLFVMGVALALLARGSGSLYPAMLMHFCHNALVVLSEQHKGFIPW